MFQADAGDSDDGCITAEGVIAFGVADGSHGKFDGGEFAESELEHRFPEDGELSPFATDGEPAAVVFDGYEFEDFTSRRGEHVLRENFSGPESDAFDLRILVGDRRSLFDNDSGGNRMRTDGSKDSRENRGRQASFQLNHVRRSGE